MANPDTIDGTSRELKLFNVFTGLFVTVIVLVPSIASKFVAIGPFNISGATLIFPIPNYNPFTLSDAARP